LRLCIASDGMPDMYALLYQCVCVQDTVKARSVIESRPDLDADSPNGDTALCKAAQLDDKPMIRMLLDAGADLRKHRRSDGCTALIVAAQESCGDAFSYLLQHMEQAERERRFDVYGHLPDYRPLRVSPTQADMQPYVQAKRADGATALFLIAQNPTGSWLMASDLVDLNHDNPTAVDDINKGPITALYAAAASRNYSMVDMILDTRHDLIIDKVNVSQYPGTGIYDQWNTNEYPTALTIAAQLGNDTIGSKIVELLVDHGADVNVTNQYGNTPLYESLLGDEYGMVLTLLKCGADMNKTAGLDGQTTLQLAKLAEATQTAYSASAELIREVAQADETMKSKWHYAMYKRRYKF
jgi:hypothetical protein